MPVLQIISGAADSGVSVGSGSVFVFRKRMDPDPHLKKNIHIYNPYKIELFLY